MIQAVPSGVKTDIVERFTISGKGSVPVTANICNSFDAISHTPLACPRGDNVKKITKNS